MEKIELNTLIELIVNGEIRQHEAIIKIQRMGYFFEDARKIYMSILMGYNDGR